MCPSSFSRSSKSSRTVTLDALEMSRVNACVKSSVNIDFRARYCKYVYAANLREICVKIRRENGGFETRPSRS